MPAKYSPPGPTKVSSGLIPKPLQGLQEDALAAALKALHQVEQAGLQPNVPNGAGLRTDRQQARLKADQQKHPEKYPFPIAQPGLSMHRTGTAMDVTNGGGSLAEQQALAKILEPHGWRWAGPRDSVHFQYVGAAIGDDPAVTLDATPTPPDSQAPALPPGSVEMAARPPSLLDLFPAPTRKAAAPAAAQPHSLLDVFPTPGKPQSAGARSARTASPFTSPQKPAARPPSPLPAGRAPLQLQVNGKPVPIEQFQPQKVGGLTVKAGVASPDLFTRTGGLFPAGSAEGGPLAQLRTFGHGIFAADNAVNAGAAHVARQIHAHGPAAIFHPKTWGGAQEVALHALTDLHHDVPPTAVRDLFGLKAGKANRAAYDLAWMLDYGLGLTAAPSNLVLGPGFEHLAVPLAKATVGKAARFGLEKAGLAVAEHLPGVAEWGQRIGTEMGIGKGAAQLRSVKRPFRIELGQRLQQAGQIGREVRDAVVRLRRADPAFDAAERAWSEAHGGASRLQELVSRYLVDPGSAMRQATHEGYDAALVKQFGDRLTKHAEETLGTLAQHGAVTPPWKNGELFRPGSAKRNGFLAGYADRVFGRTPGTTLRNAGVQGAENLGRHDIEHAAQQNMLSHVASDPALSAPITPGQPPNPGFIEIPADPRYGSLAGKQVPAPVGRFVLSELNPKREMGHPEELEAFGKKALQGWLRFTNARKKAILLGNPVGLVTSTGARVAAAEIAARRALGLVGQVKAIPRVAQALPESAQELWRFLKTGAQSKDIAALNEHSPAFMNSFATMIERGGKRSPQTLSGAGGKFIRMGKLGSVFLPEDLADQVFSSGAAAHGVLDQYVKLALFKTLRPKLGAEQAAKVVEAHLHDYSDVPALLEQLNRYGIWSFNAWPTKSAGLLFRTLKERPDLVARYPRLRAYMFAEHPGSEQAYQNLPAHARTVGTVPIGSSEFVNVGRYVPFGESFEQAFGLMQPSQEQDSQQTPGDILLGKTLPGSVLGNVLFGRDVRTGRQITPPGAPPSGALGLSGEQLQAIGEEAKPSIARGIQRIQMAQRGETASSSRYAEPQTPAEARSQYLAGVPVYHAEPMAQKKQRLAPQIETRQASASAFLDQLQSGYRPHLNPYRDDAQAMDSLKGVRNRLKAVKKYLHEQRAAANNFGKGGLTDAGRTRLERAWLFRKALEERLSQLSPQ